LDYRNDICRQIYQAITSYFRPFQFDRRIRFERLNDGGEMALKLHDQITGGGIAGTNEEKLARACGRRRE
jgi:hypothetical protein